MFIHIKDALVLGSVAVICTVVGAALYRRKDWT